MEEALIKRILPHSIEAEQSVIGSMILDRDAILVASEILTSDDFYQKQYGIIFDAMVELCNEGQPVDLITLQNRLKEKELPPDISSMEYVRDLIAAVPTSANVKYYANIVSEKAVLRRLIRTTEEVANACYLEKDSTETILEESEKKLFNILQRTNGSDYVPIQQVVLNAVSNIEKASKLKGSVTGIPTGFVDLDYKTSGMHASDLVLIAARPSMGKTAFVLNIAQYMAFRKDVTVAIFSLEMSKEQLVNRMLAMESNVDSQKLRTGTLTDADWDAVVEGIGTIGNSKLIIDDTPEAITLSSFDQTRREVARMTLERLIGDGRIHPARIEETVEKCRHDLELQMKREGERAVMELGIHGLHPDLIKLIGRLKYRTSFGQNALTHSMEVAWVAGLLAGEMGVNVTMARRAGLLHDIGKALDHEIEGSHVQIGVDICRKYKENTQIIHAIEAHHGDVEPKTPLAFIIQAADAISAARPGARRENVESYVKRLENLEEISSSFEGVEQAFAVQAGREVRILVKPDVISDDQVILLARAIAKKIEDTLDYPGQIKVNVIRESRAVEYAK